MGWLVENGSGAIWDVSRAIKIFEAAADLGNSCAMVNLGNIYEFGLLNGFPDYKAAFHWYQSAAYSGDLKGLFNYANCFHFGWGTRKNYKKAFSIFSTLVERDYKGAAFYVGLYYGNGHAVKRDYKKARHFYRLGALQDDMYCYNQLGVLYAKGLGVKKDVHAALDYYKEAAALGDALAHCNIGWLYESGELGSPNIREAIKWYQIGAIGGDEYAKEALTRLGVPIPSDHIMIEDAKDNEDRV